MFQVKIFIATKTNLRDRFDMEKLEKKAQEIRGTVLEMIVQAGKGHIGGAFSCIDILVALYYGGILKYDAANPEWSERDRFILSKGHVATALYAILADRGFFDQKHLGQYGKNGSMLGAHPDRNIPGIEINSGSLGHGLGIGAGLALAAKLDKKSNKTIVLLGDGECYEGSVWEAAMFAGHHQLVNLTAIVDRNYQCVLDFTEDCNKQEPFADKWKAFGWDVAVMNGHSCSEIINVFSDRAKHMQKRPLAIIADTIKGKGVSFMEKELVWHHKVPKGQELAQARKELGRIG